jgi:hypothetical protein
VAEKSDAIGVRGLCGLLRESSAFPRSTPLRFWIPAFAGMTVSGVPALGWDLATKSKDPRLAGSFFASRSVNTSCGGMSHRVRDVQRAILPAFQRGVTQQLCRHIHEEFGTVGAFKESVGRLVAPFFQRFLGYKVTLKLTIGHGEHMQVGKLCL